MDLESNSNMSETSNNSHENILINTEKDKVEKLTLKNKLSENFNNSILIETDEIETNFYEIIEFFEDFKSNDLYDYSRSLDKKEYETKESSNIFDDCLESKVDISQFIFIRNISKGGYGKVDLFKKKNTGDEYAIKIIDIANIKSLNVANLIKNETEILNLIHHDFLVKCYYIFSDNDKYYFVMENIQGGDLGSLMNTYKLREEVNIY